MTAKELIKVLESLPPNSQELEVFDYYGNKIIATTIKKRFIDNEETKTEIYSNIGEIKPDKFDLGVKLKCVITEKIYTVSNVIVLGKK